ncbi:MAG: hypothetical protein AMJ60_07275 [Desulfobacterales bacterium SG8_35]|nr:MAG: hypothetical protein AMJ60_07275 [Desulfobacterales bacterium SG8_35]
MKIKHIVKRWSNIFCSHQQWRQTTTEEGGLLRHVCAKCGRRKTESQGLELHILLPEKFAGNRNIKHRDELL